MRGGGATGYSATGFTAPKRNIPAGTSIACSHEAPRPGPRPVQAQIHRPARTQRAGEGAPGAPWRTFADRIAPGAALCRTGGGDPFQIGRGPGRERRGQYVYISVAAGSIKT